jgi:hypothetical protein
MSNEPVAKLKRGITGRCTRKRCECEIEGLGLECIHLEPVIDGYPLWSGIPKPDDTALLRQALDCLENHVMQRTYASGVVICNTAIALRERLALSDAALLAPKPGQLKDRGKK